jgi:hypothetical protein
VKPAEPGAVALLRHAVATVAYRGGKAVRGAPDSFGSFRSGPETRTPVGILAHVGDLFDWALGLADGRHVWHDSEPLPWDDEVARFFAALERFDARLARAQAAGNAEPLGHSPEKLFQGPVADALTHVGQLTLLRRLAGAAVKGENYFKADIAAGRVGAEQAKAKVEFE